jgi:hypothetical protein
MHDLVGAHEASELTKAGIFLSSCRLIATFPSDNVWSAPDPQAALTREERSAAKTVWNIAWRARLKQLLYSCFGQSVGDSQ